MCELLLLDVHLSQKMRQDLFLQGGGLNLFNFCAKDENTFKNLLY